ncbi:MAG: DoxX family protein [Polyangiales bacterium]
MTTTTLDTARPTVDHAAAISDARSPAPTSSKAARITGRVLTGLVTAFLLFDVSIKLVENEMVTKSAIELGYQPAVMFPIGLVLLACLVIHLIPRTAIIGAILLTGYLGGAIATHVRVGNPLASHTLFPTYVAAFIWLGLYLRDPRTRALFAGRR